MMSSKSICKCPVCGDEMKVNNKAPMPTCMKCHVKMELVKQGIMTK